MPIFLSLSSRLVCSERPLFSVSSLSPFLQVTAPLRSTPTGTEKNGLTRLMRGIRLYAMPVRVPYCPSMGTDVRGWVRFGGPFNKDMGEISAISCRLERFHPRPLGLRSASRAAGKNDDRGLVLIASHSRPLSHPISDAWPTAPLPPRTRPHNSVCSPS